MATTVSLEQTFKTYTGTPQAISNQINSDLLKTDQWYIKLMGTVTTGQGFVVWVLAERQVIS